MQTNLFTQFDIPKTKSCPEKVHKSIAFPMTLAHPGTQYADRYENALRDNSDRPFGDWETLLGNLGSLGPVEAETPNRGAVFVFTGCYDEFRSDGGPEPEHPSESVRKFIFFLDHWRCGFAAGAKDFGGNASDGLRFFDERGELIHTIRLTENSDAEAFEALARKLAVTFRKPKGCHEPHPVRPAAFMPPFDVKEFRARWLGVTNYADQIRLTGQYGLSELQGLQLMGDTWASQVPVAAIVERLGILIETGLPCGLQLANSGLLQCRTGRISRLHFASERLILSGADWSLSITPPEIDSAWVVTKPAAGRLESSIELYSRDGHGITRIHGSADPVENRIFQDLLGTLPAIE